MIALIIIGIFLALLALVLLLPLSLRLQYKDTLVLSFELLGISFPLYAQGNTSHSGQRKGKKKKKRTGSAQEKSEKSTSKPQKKATSRSVVHYIKLAGRILSRIYNRFPNCFTLCIKRFEVVIGGKDAANAAINYGLVSQSTAYVLTLIETIFRVKTSRKSILSITPNFLNEESTIALDLKLTTRLLSLLFLTLRAWGIWRIVKQETSQKQLQQTKEGV